jgi:hypothetical protein
MANRVTRGRGPFDRVVVANITIDQRTGQAASCGAARKDHGMVAPANERTSYGSPEVASAAGQKHPHESLLGPPAPLLLIASAPVLQ